MGLHAMLFQTVLCFLGLNLVTSDKTYDFIVIGAGSSGGVIARRLAENRKWNVLLLEAGGLPNPIAQYPALNNQLQSTDNNWNYSYEPQTTACLAMVDRKCPFPRGKALGGSSTINAVIYSRGHQQDFDYWANFLRDGSWAYNEVLPLFKKSEHCYLSTSDADYQYHGFKGPMGTNISYFNELGEALIKAGVQSGYQYNKDHNRPNDYGFSRTQAFEKHGRRQSTWVAFLEPYADRANLQIETYALASRILIKKRLLSNVAYGVEYYKNGTKITAKASKEVILSAGVIGSPQILTLSGVGPKEDLDRLNIPLVKDLPVGKHLKDHLTFYGLIISTNVSTTYDQEAALREFNEQGTGPLAAPGGMIAIAFLNTDNNLSEPPDLELLHFPTTLANESTARLLNVRREVYEQYSSSTDSPNLFSIISILLHPKSTGYIQVKSKDPFEYPAIHGGFFSDEADLHTFLKAIRIIQRLLDTPAYKKYNATLVKSVVPGCENLEYDSDDYWFCAFRRFTVTIYHASGTCKMGPLTDRRAVVDPKFRVYGVKNLRVADASVILSMPSGHTHAPCMMFGEKLAEILKKIYL